MFHNIKSSHKKKKTLVAFLFTWDHTPRGIGEQAKKNLKMKKMLVFVFVFFFHYKEKKNNFSSFAPACRISLRELYFLNMIFL